MMKFFLIFLFVGLCVGEEEVKKIEVEPLPGYTRHEIEEIYRDQNTEFDYIRRPCAYYDLLCIRRYLSKVSECKIAEGPVPDPKYRTQSTVYLPAFSVSITETDVFTSGLNGRITDFFFNKRDDLTVIAIEFRNVTVRANAAVFRYHRRGQEPAYTNSSLTIFLPRLATVTTFPTIKKLKLSDSETTAFLTETPIVNTSPDAGISSDPTVAPRFALILSNPQLAVSEALLTKAPYFVATYLQYDVCDFGLKVY